MFKSIIIILTFCFITSVALADNSTIQSTNSTISQSTVHQVNQIPFTNITTIRGSIDFLNNITMLHEMGYLPFFPIEVNGNQVVWQWDYTSIPKQLINLTPTSNDSILYKGAIKAFLTQTQQTTTNQSQLHKLLIEAINNGIKASQPFVWILVSQNLPERLKVWSNGQWIIESNCNTGVDNLTPNGNFIVYARYRKFTMSGIFPIDDKPYYDKDVPYVNFFNGGDAIHGFPRYAYGYPQSAGCIELPIENAKKVYKLLYVGVVVTIE